MRRIYHIDPQNPCEAILMRTEYGSYRSELQENGGLLYGHEGSFWYENGDAALLLH